MLFFQIIHSHCQWTLPKSCMPEDGDSDGGHDDENDDDDCNGDSILVDDDRYSLLMLKLLWERAVLLRYLIIDMQMKNIWAVSFISWVLTLGVRASGGSMEVGHSVEVRHKFGSMIFRRNITLFWNKHLTGVVLLVHNQSSTSISDCIFLHRTIVEIKLKVCVSSA